MPQAVYNQLLIIRDEAKYRWELFENPKLSMQDMDENEILKTVRLGIECGRLPENTGKQCCRYFREIWVTGEWRIKQCCRCTVCQSGTDRISAMSFKAGAFQRNR